MAVSNQTGLLFVRFALPMAVKFPDPVHWYSWAFDAPLILVINHLFEEEIFSKAASPLKACEAIEEAIVLDPVTFFTSPSEQIALSIFVK